MHFLLAAALFVASDSAVVSSDNANTSTKPGKEKKICRVDPASNGSRMAKSICLTAEQWDERKRNGKSIDDVKSGLVR